MKVKNIMFAGFAATILAGACGAANAAEGDKYILASKAYVTTEVGKNTTAITEEVTRAKAAEAANKALIEANAADIALKASQTALEATNAEVAKKADKSYVGTIPAESNAADVVGYVQEKTAGIATEGAMTELGNRVTAVEGKVNSETDGLATKASQAALSALSEKVGQDSVATQIATAVAAEEQRADAAYAAKDLETTVSNLATNVADNYVSNTALTQKGYQTQANVQAEIAAADIAMGKVTGLSAALDDKQDTLTFDDAPTADSANPVKSGGVYSALAGKAATGDVSALDTRVQTLEGAGYQNASQVAGIVEAYGYATADALEGVKATADAALSTETFNQFKTTNTAAIEAAAKAGTDAADAVEAQLADYTKTVDLDATYATDAALSAVDAKFDNYTTTTAMNSAIATAKSGAEATAKGYADAVANDLAEYESENNTALADVKATAEAALPKTTFEAFKTTNDTALAGKMNVVAEQGSYLVTKKQDGTVVYSAVQVVDGEGNPVQF